MPLRCILLAIKGIVDPGFSPNDRYPTVNTTHPRPVLPASGQLPSGGTDPRIEIRFPGTGKNFLVCNFKPARIIVFANRIAPITKKKAIKATLVHAYIGMSLA